MKYDIVTIGDAIEDVFVTPDLEPRYEKSFGSGKGICFEFGEKIPLNSVDYEVGGSACNVAVGLARLGFKSAIATVVGDDTPMEKVISTLEKESVNKSLVQVRKKSQTGFSVIFSINGERTIFVYHGIKDYGDLKIPVSARSRWFFVAPLGENSDEIEKRVIKEVAENGANLAWNPGTKQIEKGANHYRHLLKCTQILFLNREEAIKFLNYPMRPQEDEIMKKLHLFGAKIVVVTNGKEGARAYDGNEFYEAKADRQIPRVDSTGAGDSFASGFLGRILELDMKSPIAPEVIQDALRWGIKNSNSVIQYIGAQKGLLSKDQM